MPKRSNDFQKLLFLLKKQLAGSANVTESKMLKDLLTGSEREVDVCVETNVASHRLMVSIECTDRSRPADVTWIEEMKAKHEHLPTNALVLISRKGFSVRPSRRQKPTTYKPLDSMKPQKMTLIESLATLIHCGARYLLSHPRKPRCEWRQLETFLRKM